MERTITRTPDYIEAIASDRNLQRQVAGVEMATSPTPNTFGWDTVYAISYADVNDAIAAAGVTPPGLSQGGGPTAVTADFSDWRLGLGGGGRNIRMDIPMQNLTLGSANFGNATAHINVQLTFVPDPSNGDEDIEKMQLRFLPPASELLASQTPTVEVLSISYTTGNEPTFSQAATIRGQVQAWFNALLDFDFVFATVNVNRKAAVGDFDFMAPAAWTYAVSDRTNLADSVFGVMAVLEAGDAEGLAHQISAYTIPTGARAGFLMSKSVFLKHMVFDGLGTMFGHADDQAWVDSHFELFDNETAIRNIKALTIENLEVQPGKTKNARINTGDFVLRFVDNSLELTLTDMTHKMPYFLNMGVFDVHHTLRIPIEAAYHPESDQLNTIVTESQDDVVLTKDKTWAWIELGVLFATLALNIYGLSSAIRTVRSTSGAVSATTASARNSMSSTASSASATSNASWVSGASAIQNGRTGIGEFISAVSTAFKATWAYNIGAAFGLALTIHSTIAAIASADPDSRKIDGLPSFKAWAGQVMGAVTWPSSQAEFQPTSAQFNGAFQIGGEPSHDA